MHMHNTDLLSETMQPRDTLEKGKINRNTMEIYLQSASIDNLSQTGQIQQVN